MQWKCLAYHLPSPSSLMKKKMNFLFSCKGFSEKIDNIVIIIVIICLGEDSVVKRNVRIRQLGTLCQHLELLFYGWAGSSKNGSQVWSRKQ